MFVLTPLATLLSQLTEGLAPYFGASAAAAAIIVLTVAVRLLLHPLARAAARGEKARAALAPRVALLRHRYRDSPERLTRAVTDLHAEEGASPLAGCLPALLQAPVFFVLYHLFTSGGGTGELLGAPLGGRWSEALADGGPFGAQGLVFGVLFAAIGGVALWTYLRARSAVPGGAPTMARYLPLLSFGTIVTAAVVPLAAGLYLLTTTAWTAAERALLHRRAQVAPGAATSTG